MNKLLPPEIDRYVYRPLHTGDKIRDSRMCAFPVKSPGGRWVRQCGNLGAWIDLGFPFCGAHRKRILKERKFHELEREITKAIITQPTLW
jgi:hypothetical protein